jgi:hypothetical protein
VTFLNIALGWFMGFAFGVGCALAVLYSIYKGGYRKSIEESLMEPQPETYRRAFAKAQARRSRTGAIA